MPALALAVLLMTAPTRAATSLEVEGHPSVGDTVERGWLRVAGRRFLFVDDRFRPVEVRPGRKPRTMTEFMPLLRRKAADELDLEVEGSRTWTAVTRTDLETGTDEGVDFSNPLRTEVQVADPRGHVRTLVNCRNLAVDVLAVTGTSVAVTPGRCTSGDTSVAIYDASRPGIPPVLLHPPGRLMRAEVAGRYVAVRSALDFDEGDQAVTVFDRRSGRRVARTRSYDFLDFALQPDGLLALAHDVVKDTNCGFEARLAWATVSRPTLRPLDSRSCGTRMFAGRGRVAYERAPAGDTVVASVRGGDEKRVLAPHHSLVGFDGTSLAYATPTCSSTRLRIEPLKRAVRRPAAPLPDCPVSVAGSEIEVTADGTLAVPIACPNGCDEVSVQLFAPSLNRVLRFQGSEAIGSGPVGPSSSHPVEGRLAAEDSAQVRAAGRMDVEIRLGWVDLSDTERSASAQATLVAR
jgi:hypothetical protein